MTHVLLIEDDFSQLNLMQIYVERAGYNFRGTTKPDEGLQLAYELRPSVIMVDLMMPHISGLDIIKAIRLDYDLRDTPIVVMSTLSQSTTIYRAHEAGCDAYLIKPAVFTEVSECLAEFMKTAV